MKWVDRVAEEDQQGQRLRITFINMMNELSDVLDDSISIASRVVQECTGLPISAARESIHRKGPSELLPLLETVDLLIKVRSNLSAALMLIEAEDLSDPTIDYINFNINDI